jgi:peptide/nickel transport system ATP-binding protein
MRLLSANAKATGESLFGENGNSTEDLFSVSENRIRDYRGKHLAMIFQEPMTSLNPVFTCGDQVAEAILVHTKLSKAEAKQKAIALFEKVKLPDPQNIFSTYPHQLSGGQRQRVMIAMALSCDPSLLIADEPTSSLDVSVQAMILELMVALKKEYGMGMIFVSHDLGAISEIADRIIVMHRGKIVEQGSVADIFTNPKHPYTQGLLACRPPLNKRLRVLPVISDFINPVNGTQNNSDLQNEISIEERKKSHEEIYSRPPVLQLQNISVDYTRKRSILGKTEFIRAVDDVSFEVYPGETLGLVGESGSGKTTLGRTILKLIEPTAGKIIFKGKDISELSGKGLRKIRKNLQIIFQDPYSSLNPKMKIGKAIEEVLSVHDLYPDNRKKRVNELLEMVSMKAEHYNSYPHEFSGGQRQRICIARALASEPEFLICDECVSALDVSIQAQILNLLNNLKRNMNFTCVFISHDLSVVKFMSDRMIVLKNGKIVEEGDPDLIYAAPKSDYTKMLINSIPAIKYAAHNIE